MFYCDKCNTILAMDYKHTSIYYNDNVTTILDEFIFTPLYHKYRELTVINKEIDRR